MDRHLIAKKYRLDGINPCHTCLVDSVCKDVCDKLKQAVGIITMFGDMDELINKNEVKQ